MRPEARVGTVFEEWRLEALLDAGRVAATYTAARFRPRWPDSTTQPNRSPENPARFSYERCWNKSQKPTMTSGFTDTSRGSVEA